MTDRELLEYIAAQVGILTGKVDSIEKDVSGLKEDVSGLKGDVSGLKEGQSRIESTVVRIEQDHSKKLDALMDGYVQNTEQLNRIEKEVSKHEEIILRRVK